MVVGGCDLGFYSTAVGETPAQESQLPEHTLRVSLSGLHQDNRRSLQATGCPFLTSPPKWSTEAATDVDRIADGMFGAAAKRVRISPNLNISRTPEHKRIIPTVGVLVGVLVGIWQ